MAKAIGIRYQVNKHIGASLMYLDEGDRWNAPRSGFVPQIWLEDMLNRRWSIGIGIGPYFLTSRPQFADGDKFPAVTPMISFMTAYAITPRWIGRIIWNRVMTNHDRDSDVVLFALGYRF